MAIPTTQPFTGVVWCCQTSRRQSAMCIAMFDLHAQQFHTVIIDILNIHIITLSSTYTSDHPDHIDDLATVFYHNTRIVHYISARSPSPRHYCLRSERYIDGNNIQAKELSCFSCYLLAWASLGLSASFRVFVIKTSSRAGLWETLPAEGLTSSLCLTPERKLYTRVCVSTLGSPLLLDILGPIKFQWYFNER